MPDVDAVPTVRPLGAGHDRPRVVGDSGTLTPALADYKIDCLANRLPPGSGEFDCVGFIRTLREVGVDAPISLEVCSTELWNAPAEDAARAAADGMRAVLREAGVVA